MPRRRRAQLSINHERWLVSYADFITLLFAFFVVMYSISQVNESKYRVLSSTLVDAFKPAAKAIKPIQVGQPARSPSDRVIDMNQPPVGGSGNLDQLESRFRERFSDLLSEGVMDISRNEFWLQIQLRDNILFDSGSAEASATARSIFSQVADILSGQSNPVQIEGFTDNVPIRTDRYPSNWELSSARASAIVKWLIDQGMDPSRLAAVGYGEHQPVASNDTAEGRARNRRVAVMIARHQRDRPAVDGDDLAPNTGLPSAADSEPARTEDSAAAADNESPGGEQTGGVEAVEIGNGDLLFSSDPDLPRQNRQPSPEDEQQ